MSNKKQNAVEWIHSKILLRIGLDDTDIVELRNIIEQAKAMHKEEIQSAIIYAEREHNILGNVWPTQTVLDKAENYYNETFGGNND